jgi:hypothetical protein
VVWCVRSHSAFGIDSISPSRRWAVKIRGVRRSLERAGDFIEGLHLAEVCAVDIEIVHLPHEEGWDPDDPGALE